MKRKIKKELQEIVNSMIDALEVPKKRGDGITILEGDFVCLPGIPESVPEFDAHFIVCGEDAGNNYLVLIKWVDLEE